MEAANTVEYDDVIDENCQLLGEIVTEIVTVSESATTKLPSVTKSHKLITAFSLLNLNQQRLLAAAISKLNPLSELKKNTLIKVEMHATEISALTGVSVSNVYKFVETATTAFHSIPLETPGKKPGTLDLINIAYNSVYDPETKMFDITFHPLILPELIGLKKQFNTVKLKYLNALRSKYSVRLYELLKKGPSFVTYPLWKEETLTSSLFFVLGLRNFRKGEMVEHAPSYTTSYKEFRVRVLAPAVKEINKLTDINVTFKPFKRGKKVFSIKFSVTSKSSENKSFENESLATQLIGYGYNPQQVEEMIAEYKEDMLVENLAILKRKLDSGTTPVKNPKALLNFYIKNNVAALPDVANPYSELYKGKKLEQLFVTHYLMPIWWTLDSVKQESIETMRLTHVGLNAHYRVFKSAMESEGEMAALSYVDRDDVLYSIENARYD